MFSVWEVFYRIDLSNHFFVENVVQKAVDVRFRAFSFRTSLEVHTQIPAVV